MTSIDVGMTQLRPEYDGLKTAPTTALPKSEMRRSVLKFSAEALLSLVIVYLFNSTWLF
jgi:hypothetical protein